MTAGVYSIICQANGKRYVGSALRMRSRWACHRHALRHGRHHSQKLQRAWAKYGEAAFSFEIMLLCHGSDTRFFEQRALDSYDSVRRGYNVLAEASSPRGHRLSAATKAKLRAAILGREHTAEARKRMREVHADPVLRARINAAHIGRRNTPETIAKMRAAHAGRRCSEDTKAKLRAANVGKTMPNETRQKISAALLGSVKSAKARGNMSAAQQRLSKLRAADAMTTLGPA